MGPLEEKNIIVKQGAYKNLLPEGIQDRGKTNLILFTYNHLNSDWSSMLSTLRNKKTGATVLRVLEAFVQAKEGEELDDTTKIKKSHNLYIKLITGDKKTNDLFDFMLAAADKFTTTYRFNDTYDSIQGKLGLIERVLNPLFNNKVLFRFDPTHGPSEQNGALNHVEQFYFETIKNKLIAYDKAFTPKSSQVWKKPNKQKKKITIKS